MSNASGAHSPRPYAPVTRAPSYVVEPDDLEVVRCRDTGASVAASNVTEVSPTLPAWGTLASTFIVIVPPSRVTWCVMRPRSWTAGWAMRTASTWDSNVSPLVMRSGWPGRSVTSWANVGAAARARAARRRERMGEERTKEAGPTSRSGRQDTVRSARRVPARRAGYSSGAISSETPGWGENRVTSRSRVTGSTR